MLSGGDQRRRLDICVHPAPRRVDVDAVSSPDHTTASAADAATTPVRDTGVASSNIAAVR